MNNNPFDDDIVASLYDKQNTWGVDDEFYKEFCLSADSILDIGCGTGRTIFGALEHGFTGRAVGIDPAGPMLEMASEHPLAPKAEWIHGFAPDVAWTSSYDLVTCTGHVFQYFLTDEDTLANLRAVASALTVDGVFVFETRNPLARGWEKWPERYGGEVMGDDGVPVQIDYQITDVSPEGIVETDTTSYSPSWEKPHSVIQRLRFVSQEHLADLLQRSGLSVVEQFGDWDRSPVTDTSPEIITVARRLTSIDL